MKDAGVVLVSLIIIIVKADDETCQSGEFFSTCENPCLPSCEIPDTTNCAFLLCNKGCVCEESLIRHRATGKCIERKFCPVASDDENAVKSPCAPKCPKTCQNTGSEPCSEKCEPGYVCKDRYTKDEISGKCVLTESCPKCGTNEEYNACGPTCSNTCANKDYEVKCVPGCKPGCLCKEGYIREEVSRECVLPETCPPCSRNETFANQGMDCATCSNYKFVKCAPKNERKCYCSLGHVRDETTGNCIYNHDCPQDVN